VQRFASWEYIQHVPVEIAEDTVEVRVRGVQLTTRRLDAVLAPGLLVHADCQLPQSGSFAPLPTVTGVRWSIKLQNDVYSTQTRVLQ